MTELDPELLPLLERMPTRPFTASTLAADREAMRATWASYVRPENDGVSRTERFAPGLNGAPDVRVVLYEPTVRASARAVPAMLFIHGGGFVGGTADNGEPFNRRIVSELGIVVVSVDYRLAPESRYPCQIEDCYAALLWLQRQATVLGIDLDRVAVEGMSAGGALAASLSLMARDRGDVSVALLSLIYPMLDDRAAAEPDGVTGTIAWFRESNAFGWTSLLGSEVVGGPDVSYYAAPSRATNLRGLPPTFIGAAALDFLVYENLEFAKRLIASGVPTQVEVYPRAFHGFDVGTASLGEDFRRSRLTVLRRGLQLDREARAGSIASVPDEAAL